MCCAEDRCTVSAFCAAVTADWAWLTLSASAACVDAEAEGFSSACTTAASAAAAAWAAERLACATLLSFVASTCPFLTCVPGLTSRASTVPSAAKLR